MTLEKYVRYTMSRKLHKDEVIEIMKAILYDFDIASKYKMFSDEEEYKKYYDKVLYTIQYLERFVDEDEVYKWIRKLRTIHDMNITSYNS